MYDGRVEWRSKRPGGRAMRSVRGLGFGEGEGERFEVVAIGTRREDEDDEAVVVTVVVEAVVDRNEVMCASSFVYDSASRFAFVFEDVEVRDERMDEKRATKEKSCNASERIRPRVRSETKGRGSERRGCRAVESES